MRNVVGYIRMTEMAVWIKSWAILLKKILKPIIFLSMWKNIRIVISQNQKLKNNEKTKCIDNRHFIFFEWFFSTSRMILLRTKIKCLKEYDWTIYLCYHWRFGLVGHNQPTLYLCVGIGWWSKKSWGNGQTLLSR